MSGFALLYPTYRLDCGRNFLLSSGQQAGGLVVGEERRGAEEMHYDHIMVLWSLGVHASDSRYFA